MKEFTYFLVLTLWTMGFVVAEGFWKTLFCTIPFYALYVDIEFILKALGCLR